MIDYDKKSVVKLSGGFGTANVFKIIEKSTDTEFVLKQGTKEQNVNAVLVSEFLKSVLDNVQVTIRGKKYNFHAPQITIDNDQEGNEVQKQEFLNDLSATVDGKKIQGLVSLDNMREAAKLGAIYQFLMLGDNISHNNRISSDGRFNIFDFDSAFKLGGQCITSPEGIFHDKVVAVAHTYNDHFIDLLALKFKKDKYGYINFNQAAINELGNEKWDDFLIGATEGLELIKANITEEYIINQWGQNIPHENQGYLAGIKQLVQVRLANVDKNIAFLNDVLNQKRSIPGINVKESIASTLSQQPNVSAYLDGLKNAIAVEINKSAPKKQSVNEVNLSKLGPAPYKSGPSQSPQSPGRLYDFSSDFERSGIDFNTDLSTLSTALAVLTSTQVDEEGIHHPCTCNGPHHASIVAKFSYMMAAEMLAHSEMKQKIDAIISGLNPESQQFLTKDGYQNYKKLVEQIALLHDSGRPSDGIDQWDASNELNVITTIHYLLKTAHLSQQSITELLDHARQGVENKDNLNLKDDRGFLFGCPVGAGDSLHSGHAFHGGLWDQRSYNPNYVRVYKQYPGFQEQFINIANEIGQFVPTPTAQNGGRLAAVNKYLVWHQYEGDGKSIIKADFTKVIHEEFHSLAQVKFPIMTKHFPPQSLTLVNGLSNEQAAPKAAEQAAQKAAEQAAQKAAEQAAQKAAEQAAQKAAEQAAQKAAEQAAQKTAEQAAQKVAEQAAQKAAEQTAQKAAEQTAQKAAEQTAQKAAEQAAQKAAEQAAQKAAEQAAKKPAVTVDEQRIQTLKNELKMHGQQFNSLLTPLKLKATELSEKAEKNPDYVVIAREMEQLCITLELQKKFFEKPSPVIFQQFKQNCEQAISTVENNAGTHRGWYQVAPVIRGILGVLAAIAIIPAIIVAIGAKHGYAQTFFAKPSTDTSEKVAFFKQQFAEQKEEMQRIIVEPVAPQGATM